LTVTVAYCEVMGQSATPKHAYFEWQLSAFESMYNWWSLFVFGLVGRVRSLLNAGVLHRAFIPIVLTSFSLLYSFSNNLLNCRPYRHFYWTKAAEMLLRIAVVLSICRAGVAHEMLETFVICLVI